MGLDSKVMEYPLEVTDKEAHILEKKFPYIFNQAGKYIDSTPLKERVYSRGYDYSFRLFEGETSGNKKISIMIDSMILDKPGDRYHETMYEFLQVILLEIRDGKHH